jgi:serine protease Do
MKQTALFIALLLSHSGLAAPLPNFGETTQRALPGVVSIQTTRKTAPSVGSGVVLRADGTILTSYHVVENAEKLSVTFFGNTQPYPAKVLAFDPPTDIALIQLEKSQPDQPGWPQLFPVTLGDSDKTRAGDPVLAVGNPFGFQHSVTSGIISARGRNGSSLGAVAGAPGENGPEVEDMIQTDAAINPGNSGGPLLNAQGQMIGLNAAIFSQSGGFIGIGFAIPSRIVSQITQELLSQGRIVRGWIGVTAQSLDTDLSKLLHASRLNGALLSDVRVDSPAERAGLKAGDILVDFDGQSIRDSLHLKTLVSRARVNQSVKLQFLRNGKKKSGQIEIAERPHQPSIPSKKPDAPPSSTRELGLALQNLPSDLRDLLELSRNNGVLISQITPGSPAARAGLNTGDVILAMNQQTTTDAEKLEASINLHLKAMNPEKNKPGPLLLLVQRGPGDRIFIALPVS